MSRKLQIIKYLAFDFMMSAVAWAAFYVFRKLYIEPKKYGYKIPVELDDNFYLGLILIPLFWIFLYYSTGYYNNIYRRSRLNELGQTIGVAFWGTIILFFAIILDDPVGSYKNYYMSVSFLFIIQFTLTYIPRLTLTSITSRKIHNRSFGFKTIIIGSNEAAVEVYKEIEGLKKSMGNIFIGYINVNGNHKNAMDEHLPRLGNVENLMTTINEHKIEEVIIAIESEEHHKIEKIINKLQGCNVLVKAIPDMYDILTGKVRMSSIFGAPLIRVTPNFMPVWQEKIKFFLDIFASLFALILLLPLIIFLIIAIKLTSKGPIFYTHERLGRYGKPFKIYKFRSMYVDAEKNGPQLSCENDNRVTKIGRFMRRTRMDEIPNFINVLKGDMSLVGPRPERQYYVDQIIEIAPHYKHLQKVKPGITSWGQVKFGYASNVPEMTKRLKYDILYIENMSLFVDFKILIYTVITIFQGRGK